MTEFVQRGQVGQSFQSIWPFFPVLLRPLESLATAQCRRRQPMPPDGDVPPMLHLRRFFCWDPADFSPRRPWPSQQHWRWPHTPESAGGACSSPAGAESTGSRDIVGLYHPPACLSRKAFWPSSGGVFESHSQSSPADVAARQAQFVSPCTFDFDQL